MPYCPNCGVELAPEAKSCPLCGAPSRTPVEEERLAERLIDPEDREKLTDRERRTIIWEILSVSGLIASIAVSAVNLILDGRLSWALYPLLSLGFAWALMSSAFLLRKGSRLGIAIPILALPLFLIGIDLVDGRLGWALLPALPIALVAEIAVGSTVLLIVRTRRRGANIISFVLLAAVFLCLGIEAILDFYRGIALLFSWSAIVGFALVPVAAFLLYLHYRIGRKASLRRIFRL